jgi:2-oxoglutarate/2-oxoacid ferredoxin oxidoreductase subunit beta
MAASPLPLFSPNEIASDQEVRWCPGCGDFAILAQLKQVLAGLGVPRENLVFVSGTGCSSRLPYYLNAYGFQGLHGRAPALATGLKLANPKLQVWVITGDADGLAIGAGHLMHALRRNVDLKILLFNNETLGLTKGQHSPTSRTGTRTQTSPQGSVETPVRALTVALASEASFVARTLDVDVGHLSEVLERAAAHRGAAFVEIYQNCKVFNDGVFDYATDKSTKADCVVYLEHGRPILFGQDRNKGLRLSGFDVEVATLGNGVTIDDLIIHDERAEHPNLAFLLSQLAGPEFPECMGILRRVERPTFEDQLRHQITEARRVRGAGRIEQLLAGDNTWVVPP